MGGAQAASSASLYRYDHACSPAWWPQPQAPPGSGDPNPAPVRRLFAPLGWRFGLAAGRARKANEPDFGGRRHDGFSRAGAVATDKGQAEILEQAESLLARITLEPSPIGHLNGYAEVW